MKGGSGWSIDKLGRSKWVIELFVQVISGHEQ